MYPITSTVKALFEAEQRKVLRITGGPSFRGTKTVGPSDIVSVDDAIAMPASDVAIGIEPVQDLHGFDNPWPAGGGKNLLPPVTGTEVKGLVFTTNPDGSIKVTGTAESNDIFGRRETLTLKAGTYLASCHSGDNDCKIRVGDANTEPSTLIVQASGNSDAEFTLASDTSIEVAVRIQNKNNSSVNVTFYPMIRLSTVTDGTYAPYSNICPISGWTGAQVSHRGADTSNPDVISIAFPAAAGTVYGGTLDVTTGLLTVGRANIASYNGETLPGKWISSMDVYAAGTTPTTGAQVVYELATPQTYQLTPTEVIMLLDDNTIWADTGKTTLTYQAYKNLVITDENVMQGSFSIDRYACNGEKLEIGTAIASELKLKLNNADGAFDDILFEGAELFVEIGIADWSADEPEISWIPCGYFTSDEQPRSLEFITINALDRMVNFDKFKDLTLKPWTTNTGSIVTDGYGNIIYFVQDVNLPCTVAQLVAQIASSCNVPFDQDLTGFPNADYVVSAIPVINKETTFRNIIQWCAGVMGTNAWIDWEGKLRFSWFNNSTGYVSTTANRYSSDLYEDAVEITGVMFKDDDEDSTVYIAGTDDYALDVSSNGLIDAENATAILTNIYNVVHNFAYTPFSASVVAAPYLWPMDRVVFTDKNDAGHVSSLTNVNFGLNGTTKIQSNGKSAKSNSYAPTGMFTAGQRAELKKIAGATNSQMQEAVKHATEMITGGLGGYVVLNVNEETGETEEILIMDNPDKNLAVNVWRFNQGGLGHSSNGYNGPFNDIALTADGKINANLITTGTITDYSGNNFWNLITGEIHMTSGSIDIGNFEVDSTGALTCTGATINGTFSVEYLPVDPSQASEIGQNSYKITLGDSGFDFYANNALSGRISEYVWLEVNPSDPSGTIVHDEGVILEDVRGNGMTVASTYSRLTLRNDDATIHASHKVKVDSANYLEIEGARISITNAPTSASSVGQTSISGEYITLEATENLTINGSYADVWITSPNNSIYLNSVALYVQNEQIPGGYAEGYSGKGYCDGQWFEFRNGILIYHYYGDWTDL